MEGLIEIYFEEDGCMEYVDCISLNLNEYKLWNLLSTLIKRSILCKCG